MMRIRPFILFLFLFTVFTKTTAQSNTQALIPFPNNVITYNDGRTFKFNKKTAIKSNIQDAGFLSETLKHIIEKRTPAVPLPV